MLRFWANTTGSDNTANGRQALYNNTNGSFNVADGENALYANSNGSYNLALGYSAGSNLTTGSYNIEIGHPGVAGDNNIIRIGTPGTHTNAFIAGVITGDGSGLTNINFTQFAAGMISLAQLPAAVVTNNDAASVTLGGTFTGNGAGLTNISASAILGGLTTNFVVLAPGGGSNTLCFTNGVLMAIH